MQLGAIEYLYPRSLKHLSHQLQSLVAGRLWVKVVIGMVLGIAAGLALGPTVGWVSRESAATISSWAALPGQLFLSLMQMIVVPLVFASIIRGLVASEDVEQLKRAGGLAVVFFVLTTAVSIVIGLALALLIRPGRFLSSTLVAETLGAAHPSEVATVDTASLPETLLGLIPKKSHSARWWRATCSRWWCSRPSSASPSSPSPRDNPSPPSSSSARCSRCA